MLYIVILCVKVMRKFPLEMMSGEVDESDIFVHRTPITSWTPDKNAVY